MGARNSLPGLKVHVFPLITFQGSVFQLQMMCPRRFLLHVPQETRSLPASSPLSHVKLGQLLHRPVCQAHLKAVILQRELERRWV